MTLSAPILPFTDLEDAAVQVETPNGDRNRLTRDDRAVHDWYRFVLSFPPHLVREYLERFGIVPA